MIEQVTEILAGWSNLRIRQYENLVAIAGSYNGVEHSGARSDGIALAHDLARIAGSSVAVVEPVAKPVAAPEPEPVVEPEPVPDPEPTPEPVVELVVEPEPVVEPAPVPSEVDALRDRIAELEEQVRQLTPEPEPDVSVPPPEVLAEAQPDEDLVELKARLLGEFASLRNMLIGHIPMTEAQLLRLQALEHPKFQTWLQA
jgi:hypothetical protein